MKENVGKKPQNVKRILKKDKDNAIHINTKKLWMSNLPFYSIAQFWKQQLHFHIIQYMINDSVMIRLQMPRFHGYFPAFYLSHLRSKQQLSFFFPKP